MSSDYHLKIQLIGELREAVKIKELNLNLFEALAETLEMLKEYKRYPSPENEKRVDACMDRAFGIVHTLSPDFEQSKYHPKDEQNLYTVAI